MQVEIYEQKEIDAETLAPELDAEAIDLINELGLKGQQELTTKSEETSEVTRHHYSVVTADQQMVIEELFPSLTKVDDYSNGPIPVRVLKEIKWAKDFFKYLYVCDMPPSTIADPILLGIDTSLYFDDHSRRLFRYDNRPYLIARWGEALESWADLVEKAKIAARNRLISELDTAIITLKNQKEMIELGVAIKNRSPNLIHSLPIG